MVRFPRFIALAVAVARVWPQRTVASDVPTLEESVIMAMNRQRVTNGLQPLHLDLALALAATDRMNDLFAKHYFAHVSPDGIDPFSWIDRRGYPYREAGENLAVGYRTAEEIVDGWMHSPAHRANVLGKDYADVGIATAPHSPTRPFQGPTVVAIYGSTR
jgi:uncharacterized protein YkwD